MYKSMQKEYPFSPAFYYGPLTLTLDLIDKSNSVLPKQTVRLKTRAKIENPNLLV